MPMDSCPGQRLEYARVPGPLLCGLNDTINALLTDHLTPELVISRTPNRAKITKLAPITKSTGCWPYLSME